MMYCLTARQYSERFSSNAFFCEDFCAQTRVNKKTSFLKRVSNFQLYEFRVLVFAARYIVISHYDRNSYNLRDDLTRLRSYFFVRAMQKYKIINVEYLCSSCLTSVQFFNRYKVLKIDMIRQDLYRVFKTFEIVSSVLECHDND